MAAKGWASREKIGDAIGLLNKGEREKARKTLQAVLARAPGDGIARNLLNQIDADPKTLLGRESFPYKVRKGDTMSELAQRFLGDPMLFYALARYNGMDAAGDLAPGRTLLIPGEAKTSPLPRKPAEKERPAPEPTTASAPLPTPPVAPAPVRNPVKANELRAVALQQMNRGAIDRAVGLLRQALALDPANPLIRRDLDRAFKIRGAVRAR